MPARPGVRVPGPRLPVPRPRGPTHRPGQRTTAQSGQGSRGAHVRVDRESARHQRLLPGVPGREDAVATETAYGVVLECAGAGQPAAGLPGARPDRDPRLDVLRRRRHRQVAASGRSRLSRSPALVGAGAVRGGAVGVAPARVERARLVAGRLVAPQVAAPRVVARGLVLPGIAARREAADWFTARRKAARFARRRETAGW